MVVRPMTGPAPSRGVAIGLGIVVTFLWATSVVLIRLGLTEEDVDPIGFAGVRFTLAAILLFPVALPRLRDARVWTAGSRSLLGVAVYGLLMFCAAQLAFYTALGDLAASTVGLLMGLAPVVTAVFVMRSRHERASSLQVGGIAVLVVGVVVYFGLELPRADVSVALLAGIAIPIIVGGSAPLGRRLAVDARRLFGGPLGLTALAMTVGGITTLSLALIAEGVPSFSARAWLLIIWLAAINTALTYTLWTQTQRTLRAVESSVLGDLTVILVAVLGWMVLGEALDALQVAGLLLAVAGVFVVQLAPALRGSGSGSGSGAAAPPPA
jgi:drug/metabolite transporter (DMT)-like permease